MAASADAARVKWVTAYAAALSVLAASLLIAGGGSWLGCADGARPGTSRASVCSAFNPQGHFAAWLLLVLWPAILAFTILTVVRSRARWIYFGILVGAAGATYWVVLAAVTDNLG